MRDSLGVFDHASTGFIQNVKEVHACKVPDCDLEENAAVAEIAECDLVICHVSDGAWRHLLELKRNGLIIRVSTGGFRSADPASLPTRDTQARYILHLLPKAGDVTPADWKRILDGLSDVNGQQEIIDGGDPNGVRSLFVYEPKRVLVALAVLCQGYLSVAAAADATGCVGITETALCAMGLQDCAISPEWRMLSCDLADRWALVNSPGWWIRLVNTGSPESTLPLVLERERGATNEGAGINALLKAIGIAPSEPTSDKTQPQHDAELLSPGLVATAYLELAKLLGATK